MRGRWSRYALAGVALAFGVALAVTGVREMTRNVAGEGNEEPREPTARPAVASGPATTTPTPPAPTSTIAMPRRFTLAATGDVLLHSPVNRQAARNGTGSGTAYDYRPMFMQVAPILSEADLALCHLETPLAATPAEIRTGGTFEVPAEIVPALVEAGYDGCSTASNHAIDGGEAAIHATLGSFDEHGLGHSGTARSAEEAATPPIYEVDGVRVAHLSYAYGLNGLRVPDGRDYLVNVIDASRIVDDAATVKARGAEVVVVSLHWGTEFVRDPTGAQRAVADALGASPDVDVVVGHHAHVVQPVARVGNAVVAYGLGNFLSNQSAGPCCPAASQDGVIVEFEVVESAAARGDFYVAEVRHTATFVDRPSYTIVPVATALADPALDPAKRRTYEASLARTEETMRR